MSPATPPSSPTTRAAASAALLLALGDRAAAHDTLARLVLDLDVERLHGPGCPGPRARDGHPPDTAMAVAGAGARLTSAFGRT